MPVLIVEKGRNKEQYVEWKSPKISVGRDKRTDLKIDDTVISRHHFKIYQVDQNYYVEDLGSRNGTLVNGVSIDTPTMLNLNDRIQVGETVFSWQSKLPDKKHDPFVGKELSGYLIMELLGKGGMGRVYKAKQMSLERDVALKILSSKLLTNEVFIRKFIEEARSSAKLNHPNIIQVYDVGEAEGMYFFSMEYAGGGSVQDMISGGRKLSAEEAMPYFKDTVSGLEFAEKKKIIHCDIKPENLMLGEENIVKIGDLGLAQSLTDNPDKKEILYGTPHYFAPERITMSTIDHRSDIYSCGATFYRILTGSTPFKGKNSKEIIHKHINEPLIPPRQIDPEIPEYLENIVVKMMAKNPEDRYSSNTEILEDLEKGKRIRAVRTNTRIRNLRKSSEKLPPAKQAKKVTLQILHNILPVVVPSLAFVIGYYFFMSPKTVENIDNVDHNTKIVENTQNINTATEEETKAKETFDALYTRYINEGETEDVFAAFQKFSNDFPASNYQKRAQEVIDSIQQKKEEKQNHQLQTLFTEAKEYSERNPFDYGIIIQKYQEIISIAPNDHLVSLEARKQLLQTQNAQRVTENKQQRAIEFLQDEKNIDMLIEQKKYNDALVLIASMNNKFRDFSEISRQLQNKKDKIDTILARTITEIENKIKDLYQKNEIAEIEILLDELKQVPLPEANSKISYWELKLQELREKQENEKVKRLPAQDEQKINSLLQSYKYSECLSYLRAVERRTSDPTLKQTVSLYITDIEKLEKLLKKVNETIADEDHKNYKYNISQKKKDLELQKQLPKNSKFFYIYLKSWEESKLNVRIPFQGSSFIGYSINLEEMPFDWVYENLLKEQWNYQESDYLLLATFCFHYRQYDEFWGYYKTYTKRGNKKDAESLYERMLLIEKEAQNIYEKEYLPKMLKVRELLYKAKQGKLDATEETLLEKERSNFEKIDKNYRSLYGKTTFFLEKRDNY